MVGPFTESNNLVTLQDVTDAYYYYKHNHDESYLRKVIMPMEIAVEDIPKIIIKDSAVSAICHGADLASGGIIKLSKNIKSDSTVAIMTLKGEIVASGNSLFNAEDLANVDSGIVVNVNNVFMDTNVYPVMWK